ncbi:MAG TPA: hypothetical protein VGD81_04160 [Opitutaceae bacterium]
MHTFIITAVGLFLLWASLRIRRIFPRIRQRTICYVFIVLWAMLTATSATFGVRGGYAVLLETVVFLVTFSIPAFVALRKRDAGIAGKAVRASQNKP